MTRASRILLSVAFLATAVAGALFPLAVLDGMSELLFGAGFALAVTGVMIRPRTPSRWPALGLVLSLLGALLLPCAAFTAGGLAYTVDIHRIHPGIIEHVAGPRDLRVVLSFAVAAALAMAGGLRLRAGLSAAQTWLWGGATLAVPIASFALFLLLDRFFPIIM